MPLRTVENGEMDRRGAFGPGMKSCEKASVYVKTRLAKALNVHRRGSLLDAFFSHLAFCHVARLYRPRRNHSHYGRSNRRAFGRGLSQLRRWPGPNGRLCDDFGNDVGSRPRHTPNRKRVGSAGTSKRLGRDNVRPRNPSNGSGSVDVGHIDMRRPWPNYVLALGCRFACGG